MTRLSPARNPSLQGSGTYAKLSDLFGARVSLRTFPEDDGPLVRFSADDGFWQVNVDLRLGRGQDAQLRDAITAWLERPSPRKVVLDDGHSTVILTGTYYHLGIKAKPRAPGAHLSLDHAAQVQRGLNRWLQEGRP